MQWFTQGHYIISYKFYTIITQTQRKSVLYFMFLFRSIFVGSFLFKISPSFVKIIDCGLPAQPDSPPLKKTALPGINSWSEATLSSPHSSLLVVNKSQQNFSGSQYYFSRSYQEQEDINLKSWFSYNFSWFQTKRNPMILRTGNWEYFKYFIQMVDGLLFIVFF